jgi:hypothetical protein
MIFDLIFFKVKVPKTQNILEKYLNKFKTMVLFKANSKTYIKANHLRTPLFPKVHLTHTNSRKKNHFQNLISKNKINK